MFRHLMVAIFLFASILPASSVAQWLTLPTPSPYPHIAAVIENSGRLYIGAEGGGVYVSTDSGITWSPLNQGITNKYINSMAISGANLIAAAYNYNTGGTAFFYSSDEGSSWNEDDSTLSGVTFNVFVANGSDLLAGTTSGVLHSTDNGVTWSVLGSQLYYNVVSLAVSGSNIFAGTTNRGIFRTTNGGVSWTAVNSGMGTVGVFSLLASGSILYAGTSGSGIFKSTDEGGSWNAVVNGLPYTPTSTVNTIISLDTNILAGTDQGVFLSVDSAATWAFTNLTGGSVFCVDSSFVFSGTSGGLYRLRRAYLKTPSPPSQLAPINGSTGQALRTTSQWDSSAGATSYHFQLSLDSGFAATVFDDSSQTSFTESVGPLVDSTTYYWRVRSHNYAGYSIWSPVFHFTTYLVSPPILLAPSNGNVNQWLGPTLSWNVRSYASSYHLELSADSNFASLVADDSTVISSAVKFDSLRSDSVYFWRVSSLDSGNVSGWSPVWRFTTYHVAPPVQVSPLNGSVGQLLRLSLKWNALPYSSIYRVVVSLDSMFASTSLADSTVSADSIELGSLVSNTTYFWRVSTLDSGNSSVWSPVWHFRTKPQLPQAASLTDVYQPDAGSALSAPVTFSSAGSYSKDGVIDSTMWYVNGSLVSIQSQMTYNFGQGTNIVRLVVEDNFGGKDTSIAIVSRSKFKSYLAGPVYAGPSMLGDDVLYVIGSGDAVYRIDTAGNKVYSLQVGGEVKSSSSIAYDTTVYIASSDKNLYAFSKAGISLWPALPLGGVMTSTPAVDSLSNSIYVGISNNNFFAVNRTSGIVAWNYFVDAPVVGCAVITLDRKLVFATVKGTIYGFDLAHLTSSPSPAWQLALSDSIYGSPAVDDSGNLYFASATGKLYRISLPRSQSASVVWEAEIGGALTASPVIDGYGTIYIGSSDGKLYAVDSRSGSTKWYYSTGSPIYSTAAVSDVNMIYVGNHGGKVCALDTSSTLHWYYQDSTSVDAPLLYHNGTLYVGTTGGRLIAFYDDADSTLHAARKSSRLKTVASASPVPMWGTFQGNNQRTGLPVGQMVTAIRDARNSIPKTFSLYQNYPNPFNPTTLIDYQLPRPEHVTLRIYDILGREVETLVDEQIPAGTYRISFDGSRFASGVYLYRLQAGTFDAVRKFVLMK